eukprot:534787_1
MAQYKGTVMDAKRARQGEIRREKQKHKFNEQKAAMHDESEKGLMALSDQFSSTNSKEDILFKQSTVGFMTSEDYKLKKDEVAKKKVVADKQRRKEVKKDKKRRKSRNRKQSQSLSFQAEEEDDIEVLEPPKKKTKNPSVDTSFLPDRDRDEKEMQLRLELEEEWKSKQDNIKKEMQLRLELEEEWKSKQDNIKKETVEITYSYWDGSGHRKKLLIEKGKRIGQFLEAARLDLAAHFAEMRSLMSENLMYIKEDLIIPHNYTFYDLIVSKARGKSGPLFCFDVHDDVRLVANARVEKDESHAGKIVTRSWFERNKLLFPASRWEVYDPSIVREKYTVK